MTLSDFGIVLAGFCGAGVITFIAWLLTRYAGGEEDPSDWWERVCREDEEKRKK